MPRTSNKVDHSFQRMAVFSSAPGSHMEYAFYKPLLLQMLSFSLQYYDQLL